jgi:RND superfamily putative drug exporter
MLTQLGTWVVRHRIWVLVFWILLIIPSVFAASRLSHVLQGEVASAKGDEMYRQEHLINQDFPEQNLYSIMVVLESKRDTVDAPAYQALIQRYLDAAEATPGTAPSVTYRQDSALLSEDQRSTYIAIGLEARDYALADKLSLDLVKNVRAVPLPDGFDMKLTGGPLFGREITTLSAKDGFNTEKRVLPIVLVVLIFAFGGILAAGLPLITGVLSMLITLALLYVLAHFMTITSLSQNIVSMLGLGVGIDYSLLMVSRFREEFFDKGYSKEEAAIRTVESAGRTILYSGTVVSIGLVALLMPNVVFMTSLGLSGLLVVISTIAVGLTLIPALLSLIGPHLNAPQALANWTSRMWGQSRFWYHWAKWIMKRPIFFTFVSIAALASVSLITFEMKVWNTSIRIMPEQMETRQGFEKILEIDPKNLFAPIIVSFESKDGSPIWTDENVAAIHEFAALTGKTFPIAGMIGMANGFQPLEEQTPLYNTIAGYGGLANLQVIQPNMRLPYISSDETKAMIAMFHEFEGYGVQESGADIDTIKGMREFRDQMQSRYPNLEIMVGGLSAIPVEMRDAIYKNFPFVVLMTVIITYLLTMFSFGSVLLPLKAVFLNVLSVTATYGCMILVFQKGMGASLIGMEQPPGALLIVSPLILFCLIFGLSMDYEIFLINRIREEYDASGDYEEAIALGMEKTGAIITNAGLIMILIFMGFAFARIVVIKEFGFGMAVAIFIDATIIRLMVVPAMMKLFGRGSWYFPKFLDIPLLRKILKE